MVLTPASSRQTAAIGQKTIGQKTKPAQRKAETGSFRFSWIYCAPAS
jgi:hypothetical protein